MAREKHVQKSPQSPELHNAPRRAILRRAKEIYKCPYDRACKGGIDIGDQCNEGHTGAVCAACKAKYEYDPFENRCKKCGSDSKIATSAGTWCLVGLVMMVCGAIWLYRYGTPAHWYLISRLARGYARDETSEGADTGTDLVELKVESTDPEMRRHEEQRQKLWKSILSKLKIIVAAWQIASSVEWVLPQVSFPEVYQAVIHTLGILGLSFIEVTSFECLFNWTYFHKLVFATVCPFLLIGVSVSIYVGWSRWRGAFEIRECRERVIANATYCTLLLLYITLPGASSWIFRYFNCVAYDRGDWKKVREVLQADPTVRCTTGSYRKWKWYIAPACAVWPVGMPLCVGILLWRNRRRLSPEIDENEIRGSLGTYSGFVGDASQRELRRHTTAITQLKKLEIRDNDAGIRWLEFVFEE